MSHHIETIKSSNTIPWRHLETITVRDGQGRGVETMTVLKIERGQKVDHVTFEIKTS
jgi:hypothetical protein